MKAVFRKIVSFKNKKIFFGILFLITLFCIIFHSKNYEMEYTINDVRIIEKFNQKEKIYEFLFQAKDKEFFVAFNHKYIHSKKLIKQIEVKEKENIICLFPKSEKMDFQPLCMQDNELISYYLVDDEELVDSRFKKEILYEEKTYNNINLYYLNNKKYYIWNYEGFYVISNKETKEIKLFQDDIYRIPLTIQVNDNLLIADYDSKYEFNKFYVINSKKDKVRELNLENVISFDSYFLGTTKKKVYLIDKKNKREYEIYPKRLLIENITNNNQGRILNEEVWEPISMTSLVNNENKFTYKELTKFKIENNILYKVQGNYQTKLSNQSVKDIIYYDKDTVYYLVDEKLYYYSDNDGEVLVMSSFEWNFNYKNMIYVF